MSLIGKSFQSIRLILTKKKKFKITEILNFVNIPVVQRFFLVIKKKTTREIKIMTFHIH